MSTANDSGVAMFFFNKEPKRGSSHGREIFENLILNIAKQDIILYSHFMYCFCCLKLETEDKVGGARH